MLTCSNTKIRQLVEDLSDRSSREATIFPIDREFVLGYLNIIQKLNAVEFLFCNLELMDSLYVNQLFVCLPEVWQKITVDDISEILESFTRVYSYYSLLKFTYKYLEIDIINLILESRKVNESKSYRAEIISYLKSQWNVLIKSPGDLEDFRDGFIEVNYDEWMYIKQRLLVDARVLPALIDFDEMEQYIKDKFG